MVDGLCSPTPWLGYLPCPVMCLIGDCGTAVQVGRVLSFWDTHNPQPEAGCPSTAEIIADVLSSVASSS